VKVVRLEVGPLACNAYLLVDEAAGAGAVIDPGAEGGRIVRECKANGLTPMFIVNTHAHVDHIGANAAVKEAFPKAQLCVGRRDADRLTDPAGNLAAALAEAAGCGPPADLLLEDGGTLQFGACTLRVLETPGHTPGSVCLLAEREAPPQLFCGDLLFRMGVGRTDLPGGDWTDLVQSIRDKVLSLPDDAVLWPGHGPATSVGRERRGNPFLA
jgi:glyoxylase-like metal-dependent hydrolase (beta-lactamase superfamily II)